MTRIRLSGPWTPVFAGVGGSAISLAVGLGQGKWEPIVIGEVVTAMAVIALCFVGAQDTDVGAVLARRADERQVIIRMKASRVAAVVGVLASVVACVIAAARNGTYWPFEVIYIAMGVSYLVSIAIYGAAPKSAGAVVDDDADHVDP